MHAQRSIRQKKRVNERRKRVLTLTLLIISLMLAVALGVFLGVNYHPIEKLRRRACVIRNWTRISESCQNAPTRRRHLLSFELTWLQFTARPTAFWSWRAVDCKHYSGRIV